LYITKDPGDHDERTADETQPRHTSRHQLGTVHQVTQHHSVGETSEEARSDKERSVVERDEHIAENGVEAAVASCRISRNARAPTIPMEMNMASGPLQLQMLVEERDDAASRGSGRELVEPGPRELRQHH
jgi:hypothetical protein